MKPWFFIIVTASLMAGFLACHRETRYLDEAEELLQQGLELRAGKNTEAAAESFSQALLAVNRCDPSKPEVKLMKTQVEDQLGAMYWKHGMSEEALELHLDAVALSRELDNDTLLMKALRNCGRVTASMQQTNEARSYYEEAMQWAETLHDTKFHNELLMETANDLYLEGGDYQKAVENATKALTGGSEPGFCHLVIGLSYYYLEEDSLAMTHLREATRSEKPSIRRSAYQGLYQLYQLAGDYPKALECHELFSDNMMQADQEFRSSEVERIKAEYDLRMQQYQLQAEQKQKTRYLYFILAGLLLALVMVLLLLKQKSLSAKLKAEEIKNQLELELKKNKVYVTALALTEQITASTLDFDLKDNEWDEFVTIIDKVYGGFTQRLAAQYPSLTKSDLQICCLAKQGFSNQVISILLNLQTNSYARRKSRIKQDKMNGLNDERSFEEMINDI